MPRLGRGWKEMGYDVYDEIKIDRVIPRHVLQEMTAGVMAQAHHLGDMITWDEAAHRALNIVSQAERWKIMQRWIDQKKVQYDPEKHEWVVSNGGPTILTFPVEGPRPTDAKYDGHVVIPKMVSEILITQIALVLR